MAGMPVTTSPCNTATTGSAGEQRDVLAVTRVAAKLQKAAMAESERQALHQVALSAVPELVSAAVGTSRRVDEGLSGVARKQNKGSQPTVGGGTANGKPMPTAGGVVRVVSSKDVGGASVSTMVSMPTALEVLLGGGGVT